MERTGEPAAAPAAAGGHFAESACLNCGTTLAGEYCHGCGQQAHLHRTIGAFLHDLLHGVLHFEGRTWRTLPLLATQPGKLTRDYIDGHRARYVGPMALFLFGVFLMFAVFQAAGISAPTEIEGDVEPDMRMQQAQEVMADERDDLLRRRDLLPPADPALPDIDARLAAMEQDLAAMGTFRARVSDNVGLSVQEVDTGNATVDEGLRKWRQNPGLMLYKLQANSYKFSWLLIPLSLPFVALLFAWRRRFGLYDHAVFVTYSIAFMTLFFIAVTLLALVGVPGAVLGLAATLLPPLHIYRQLRGTYALGRLSALWRALALLLFIGVVLVLFALALLGLGTLG